VPAQEVARDRRGFHEALAVRNPVTRPEFAAAVRFQVMSDDVLVVLC
jgi:hypothetical protein